MDIGGEYRVYGCLLMVNDGTGFPTALGLYFSALA